MTTVVEIESAVAELPVQQVDELASWLAEHQLTLHASSEVFRQYDAEEGDDGDQWIGEQ